MKSVTERLIVCLVSVLYIIVGNHLEFDVSANDTHVYSHYHGDYNSPLGMAMSWFGCICIVGAVVLPNNFMASLF